MKKAITKKKFLRVFLFFGIILLIFFINPVSLFKNKSVNTNLQSFADQIEQKCLNSSYRSGCYDLEIPKLMDRPANLSMEDAFAVTKLIQEKDQNYKYCHVLGHKLSAKETKKDLSRWKEVVSRCPQTMCNNGCLHGPFLVKFQKESFDANQILSILDDLKDICEPRDSWRPAEIEVSMCYHGLGHLNMYLTKADVKKSLGLCNLIGRKNDGRDYTQTCIEAVFMQIFQPFEPEDKALLKNIKPEMSNVKSYCEYFTGEPYHACSRESWPTVRDRLMSPDGLTEFCSYTSDPLEQKKCYHTVLNMITVVLLIDQNEDKKLIDYCSGLLPFASQWCFGQSAERLIQIDPSFIDKAVSICNKTSSGKIQKYCYESIVKIGKDSFSEISQQFLTYCEALPIEFRQTCIKAMKK